MESIKSSVSLDKLSNNPSNDIYWTINNFNGRSVNPSFTVLDFTPLLRTLNENSILQKTSRHLSFWRAAPQFKAIYFTMETMDTLVIS